MLYVYKKNTVSRKLPETKTRKKANHFRRRDYNFLYISLFVCTTMFAIYYSFPYVSVLGSPGTENALGNIAYSTNIESLTDRDQSQSEYYKNAAKSISYTYDEIRKLLLHPELESIKGELTISIPKLKSENLPVEVNVDSSNEKIYMPILNNKLAHFKGTSLPGYRGNVFIYGHSTNQIAASLNSKHPSVVFTYLYQLDIGDEIIAKFNGLQYRYVVSKMKIVTPEDITPIYSREDSNTLTLMTCWPPGIGTDRLIVIANQSIQ